MSGYTDDTMVRHGIQDAETNFLAKPFTPRVLSAKFVRFSTGRMGSRSTRLPAGGRR